MVAPIAIPVAIAAGAALAKVLGNKKGPDLAAAHNAMYTAGGALPAFSGSMVIDPTNGETPLAELPKYGGAGGSYQAGQAYAAQDFVAMFGRNPTASELAQLATSYISGDPNIANTVGGRAAVAAYYQSQLQDPQVQQKMWEKAAPEQYGAVDEAFQANLGRVATDQEKAHFGTLLASGQADAYSLGQWLQQLPEYVKKEDEEYRKSLSGELQAGDVQYYNENILPAITSDLAKRGLATDSSGYANALALAAQQQNRQREQFLSNLSAQQYMGSKAAARSDYEKAIDQYFANQNYAQLRSDTLADRAQQRVYELQDFNNQRQVYEDYLRKYGKSSSSGMGSFIGGAIGTGIGAYYGGSAGAQAGYDIGSGSGSAFNS